MKVERKESLSRDEAAPAMEEAASPGQSPAW
jgi:hypothetical protein